jgi:8-oxo-dGTP pyrophosphatase MutT (NUDIX family)
MVTDVPVRDAATVVLLREGTAGLEAWLLTRVTGMAFAAGMSVFPGGRVEDADADLPFAGDGTARAAARFGCDERAARALLGGAVRETFEETGVLLSVPAAGKRAAGEADHIGSLARSLTAADLSGARGDVEAGRVSFGELLRANGLAVDSDALRPWSRWITPPGESRRYDTRFFIGAVPDGVDALDGTSESSAASWVPLGVALEQAQRGERGLLPPTVATLTSLMPFDSVAAATATADSRSLEPINPTIRRQADGNIVAELPDGTSFTLPASLLR